MGIKRTITYKDATYSSLKELCKELKFNSGKYTRLLRLMSINEYSLDEAIEEILRDKSISSKQAYEMLTPDEIKHQKELIRQEIERRGSEEKKLKNKDVQVIKPECTIFDTKDVEAKITRKQELYNKIITGELTEGQLAKIEKQGELDGIQYALNNQERIKKESLKKDTISFIRIENILDTKYEPILTPGARLLLEGKQISSKISKNANITIGKILNTGICEDTYNTIILDMHKYISRYTHRKGVMLGKIFVEHGIYDSDEIDIDLFSYEDIALYVLYRLNLEHC